MVDKNLDKKIKAASKKLKAKVLKMVIKDEFEFVKLIPKEKKPSQEDLMTKIGYRTPKETHEEWCERRDNFVPKELPPGKHSFGGFLWDGETKNSYVIIPPYNKGNAKIVYDKVTFDKEAVFKFFKELGIRKLEISFSGGHDSGSEDGAQLWFDFTKTDELDKRGKPIWKKADLEQNSTEDIFFEEGTVERYAQPEKWVKTDELDEKGYPKRKKVPNEIYQDWFDNAKEILNSLSRPIYDKYGSFAGEFSVEGRLIYDIEKEEMTLQGSESCWEGFTYTL